MRAAEAITVADAPVGRPPPPAKCRAHSAVGWPASMTIVVGIAIPARGNGPRPCRAARRSNPAGTAMFCGSQGKHANYKDEATCNAALAGFPDDCSNSTVPFR